MGRKIAWLLVVGALLVGGTFALNEVGDRSASATDRARVGTRLGSARGLGVTISLTDYSTHRALDCGGTYVIQSWVAAKVEATARVGGDARLVYMTNENGAKYWHAKAFSVHLKRGSQVIGRTDQWPDRSGESARYTFTVDLYRRADPKSHPQASTRCAVTVSKAP
jgi:hypothetical protein